jgi:glycosyltransferase involved in cell wall biosynthesis
MTPMVTVIIPTHNPDPERLRLALHGLRSQTLDAARWETLIVDNASTLFPDAAWFVTHAPNRSRVVREAALGLSAARRRGFQEAAGECAVLVDDDNVLAPDYLEQVLAIFAHHPKVGAAGGRTRPRFDEDPPAWAHEFFPLLALRDLGDRKKVSEGLRPEGAAHNQYPAFAPIGAGMALRRRAWDVWLARPALGLCDRRGNELSSGGDNDIVLCAMRGGWEVGYFPELALTHLIPRGRFDPHYLERLNYGIQRSWMQVLTHHEANPWTGLTPVGAALRKAKAWLTYRAWASPAARIRWSGACGHFEGRVTHAK